jgi:hypothetical protein
MIRSKGTDLTIDLLSSPMFQIGVELCIMRAARVGLNYIEEFYKLRTYLANGKKCFALDIPNYCRITEMRNQINTSMP